MAALPLCLALGVDASAPALAPVANNTSAAELRTRVQELVGSARCSSDADCRTLAIGAKACGGPEAYIAWSVRSSEEAALSRAVAEYNTSQQATNLREGRISTCEFVTDPGAMCVAADAAGARCQLRQRSGRNGNPSSR